MTLAGREPLEWGLAVLVGLPAGVVAVFFPQYAIAACLIAFAVAGTAASPKAATGAVVLVVLLAPTSKFLVPQSTIVDEAAILLFVSTVVVREVLQGSGLRSLPGIYLFAGFAVCGAASSVVNDVPLNLSVLDGFLLLKGVVFAFAVYQINWDKSDIPVICRVAAVAIAGFIATTGLGILIGGPWYDAFAVAGGPTFRGGIANPIGLLGHPGRLGQVAALASIGLVAYMGTRSLSPGKGSFALLAGSVIITVLTLRRKAIVGLLAASTVVILLVSRRNRAATTGLLGVLIGLSVIVGWDTIRTVVSTTYDQYFASLSGATSRTALYSASIDLGFELFPFGTGLGRFGTITAFENYSPVYYQLGLDQVWGLQPGEGEFATDTFWPAILGESGFLGALFYSAGLVALLLPSFALRRRAMGSERSPELLLVALVVIGWWIEFLIESTAAPVYTAPPTYALLFGAMALSASLEARYRLVSVGPKSR